MNLTPPLYTTPPSENPQPVFVSSLVFDGKNYTGEVAKSKKVAEQLAARSAIQSLLGITLKKAYFETFSLIFSNLSYFRFLGIIF